MYSNNERFCIFVRTKAQKMIKIILLIDCTSEFDRKLLRGMMKYSKENGPWLFYRTPSDPHFEGSPEKWIAQWAKEWKADAIIGRWDEKKLDLLNDLDIPIVLQNITSRILKNMCRSLLIKRE